MVVNDILRIEDIENEKYDLMSTIFDYKINYTDAEKEIAELESEIRKLNSEKKVLIDNVYRFIETIKNDDVKEIIERRAIKRQTWERIGFALYMDRRTASRKYYKALKGMEMVHLREQMPVTMPTTKQMNMV